MATSFSDTQSAVILCLFSRQEQGAEACANDGCRKAANKAFNPVYTRSIRKKHADSEPDTCRASTHLRIPATLGFTDTSEMLDYQLPWIGQERAEMARPFGLTMDQPDYTCSCSRGRSGRSSLLKRAMQTVAAEQTCAARPVLSAQLRLRRNIRAPCACPPDKGRLLRQLIAADDENRCKREIPQCLDGQEFKAESERIENTFKTEEAKAYANSIRLPRCASSRCTATADIWSSRIAALRSCPFPKPRY